MSRAIFTLQHNEQYYLPKWIKYYRQFFAPSDIYILSHNCSGITNDILQDAEDDGINVHELATDEIFNHDWLLNTIQGFQRELLERYDYVVFTDCDEFLCPTDCTLGEFLDKATDEAYRANGIDVIENKMYYSWGFSKTLISRIPLMWVHGYHTSVPEFQITPNLNLYHIHKLNYQEALERNLRLSQEKWDAHAVANALSIQNQIANEEDFRKMFWDTGELIEQDDTLKRLLDVIGD